MQLEIWRTRERSICLREALGSPAQKFPMKINILIEKSVPWTKGDRPIE